MGFSGSDSEVVKGGKMWVEEMGLDMDAQLIWSLHYLYLILLFTLQLLLHSLGCIRGNDKDRYL